MQANKYDPQQIETKWYQFWEQNDYFKPSMDLTTPSFSIQLPPPNVTGVLHMGHAFNQTIMDSLIRYHRMRGENVCWLPGSDHAGIATQIVVERQLAEAGENRYDLGRALFLQKVWDWKEVSGDTMKQQMQRLGCSADWSREYFTMDETRADVVSEVFVRLYRQGLIYRGKRLVNWDPVLETAVSDLEVENIEEQGFMWQIKYVLVNDPSQALVVATTRPETLLGDVAVAVNPHDERYQHLIGQQVHLPLTGRTIPIIADDYVDQDFGTGCVKITPAHDFNDYQVGQRHHTQLINIFDLTAKVRATAQIFYFNENKEEPIKLPKQYAGLDRYAARKAILADLQQEELLLDTKPHMIMTPKGDRTGSVIEPLLTDQWFVSMQTVAKGDETGQTLVQKAKQAVDSKAVKFVPENWVNTYKQWMNNIQDWCISRQLWWGHQIPAWYDAAGNIFVAKTEQEAQQQAGMKQLTRDEDVLDTWFSSALVPFSTLGWPQQTAELKAFLPSSLLVTGYEIIFFWVARMIMLTTHFTGKVPFPEVYIHGIIRDNDGKKMSKSEGNVIDPVDLISGVDLATLLEKRTTGLRQPEKAPQIMESTQKTFPDGIPAYGADALRFTMASYASLGRAINFDFKRCEGYRNFCNKIWNASRFVSMNVENQDCGQDISLPLSYSFVDKWIISRLQQVEQLVTAALNTYRLDLAAQILYEFIWNEYCDWYVELAKVQLRSESTAALRTTRRVLLQVLEASLRLLHPIMPFITEEIWQQIAPLANAKHSDSIMLASWPSADLTQIDELSLSKMIRLQNLVNAIRNLKAEMGLNVATKPPLYLEGDAIELQELIVYLPMIARLSEVHLQSSLNAAQNASIGLSDGVRFMLKVEINKSAEIARLNKECEKTQKLIDKIDNKLNKPGYQEKAPAHLVEKDIAELAGLNQKMQKMVSQLNQLEQN